MKSSSAVIFRCPRISLPFTAVLAVILFSAAAMAASISTTNKFAWSENAGWVNFNPAGGGANVEDNHLTGYVWSEGAGWIKLGANAGGPYLNTSAADWGVNRDVSGALSGYAWSENAGWINFNPTGGGVAIDGTTGDFFGYAWSEGLGWICFAGEARPTGCRRNYSPKPIRAVRGEEHLTPPSA